MDSVPDGLGRGRIVNYSADGLSFKIDFARGRWRAGIEDDRFDSGMPPRGGEMRVELLVGGGLIADQTITLQPYTTRLRYPHQVRKGAKRASTVHELATIALGMRLAGQPHPKR